MYYRISCDAENYRNYILKKEEVKEGDELYRDKFDGSSQKDNYETQTFVMTRKREVSFPVADIFFSDLPVCSERAKEVIESICNEGEIEFLPCEVEATEGNYYILNVLGAEDCVDYDNSDFVRFSSGRIMFFNHIKFNKKIERHFFRITDLINGFYFISEETKEILEKADLKGLVFDNSLFIEKSN